MADGAGGVVVLTPSQTLASGTTYGIRAARILFFARTSLWAIVTSGTRNALAISAVVSPPTARNVRAIADGAVSAG